MCCLLHCYPGELRISRPRFISQKHLKCVFCVFDIELTSKAQSFSFGGLSAFKTVRATQDLQGSKTSSPSHANFASRKHCCKCKVRRLMKRCLKKVKGMMQREDSIVLL